MQAFIAILKLAFLFASRWIELDKEKRAKKKELTKEVVDAFKEPDKKIRASRINATIGKL